MADYVYKGLTGVWGTITIADPDTATIDDVITAIAADEGLPTQYYSVSVEDNPNINDITYGDSSTPIAPAPPTGLGITTSDRFISTTRQSGLTKEERQIQKLEIAKLKRQAGGDTSKDYYRELNVYNTSLLPNPYNDNDADPDDGDAGPLNDGRPWTTS
jgi:hypothetical protein